MQCIQVLAFVFMQTLNLCVENRFGIQRNAILFLYKPGKRKLIFPLDLCQLFQGIRIFRKSFQLGKLGKVLQIVLLRSGRR